MYAAAASMDVGRPMCRGPMRPASVWTCSCNRADNARSNSVSGGSMGALATTRYYSSFEAPLHTMPPTLIRWLATCPADTRDVLLDELRELGVEYLQPMRQGVAF